MAATFFFRLARSWMLFRRSVRCSAMRMWIQSFSRMMIKVLLMMAVKPRTWTTASWCDASSSLLRPLETLRERKSCRDVYSQILVSPPN